ncbi:MAG TPA: PqqD family protein [Bacteroidales bacterium]
MKIFDKLADKITLRKANALELIPVKLVNAKDENIMPITLLVPRFNNRFLTGIIRRPEHFTVRLDETGSKVWLLIDGKRNVFEITQHLCAPNEPSDEWFRRVAEFVTSLYKKDLVKLEVKKEFY